MRNFLIFLLVVFTIISCDSNRVYDQYQSMENNTWLQSDIITFDFSISDTISKNNIFINLRNNKDYEFSNLFMITKMDFPNGTKIIDTLEYEMTDKLGNFLGSGYTDIKQNKLFYKENVQFLEEGDYRFQVEQAMRKNGNIQGLDSLKGITDIGLRIELTTE